MLKIMSVLVVGAAIWFALLTASLSRNFDFRAFYCGGAAILQRADPYRTQPLYSCERFQTDNSYAAFAKRTVLPAPQPPYVLALFAGFALLPFAAASKIWAGLILLAACASIVLIAKITQVPVAICAAAMWLSLCVTSIYLGELIPLFVCLLAAAAYCAQREWWPAAGGFAVLTLIEPHLGLAVCAGMALWAPRSRLALLTGVVAMCALAALAVGPQVILEYFQRVLPLHALSEAGSDGQLSATAIAHALGASNAAALRAGSVSFVLAAAVGVRIAPVLAAMYRDRAFLVLTPAAFSLIGGVFLHVTDLAAAIPFVLLLMQHELRWKSVFMASCVLLAVPWFALVTPMLLGTVPGCTFAGIAVFYILRWTAGSDGLAVSAALIAGFGAFFLVVAFQSAASHAVGVPAPPIPSMYPEAGWSSFNAAFMSSSAWPGWLLRGMSWLGLLLMAAGACLAFVDHPSRLLTAQAGAKLRV